MSELRCHWRQWRQWPGAAASGGRDATVPSGGAPAKSARKASTTVPAPLCAALLHARRLLKRLAKALRAALLPCCVLAYLPAAPRVGLRSTGQHLANNARRRQASPSRGATRAPAESVRRFARPYTSLRRCCDSNTGHRLVISPQPLQRHFLALLDCGMRLLCGLSHSAASGPRAAGAAHAPRLQQLLRALPR